MPESGFPETTPVDDMLKEAVIKIPYS